MKHTFFLYRFILPMFVFLIALPPGYTAAAKTFDSHAAYTKKSKVIHHQTIHDVDPDLNVEIAPGNDYVILENSKIRVRYDDFFQNHQQFAIKEFLIKAIDENQAGSITANERYLDADAGRGTLISATLIYDGTDRKTVRFVWNSEAFPGQTITHEVSIYPYQNYLEITYINVQYGTNIVDLGSPGGTDQGVHAVYHHNAWMIQETHNRENDPPNYGGYITHDVRPDIFGSYYNRYPGDGVNDPEDGGNLAYKGHFVAIVYNPNNGHGFGRVMPVEATHIFKLLLSNDMRNGFEMFPYPFYVSHPSFTGYLFAFTGGPTAAINTGRRVVDNQP